MDLASLDTVKGANAGFDVKIYHPGTNEDIGVNIRVLGKDSDEFQRISRAQQKRRMDKLTKGGFRGANIPLESIEQDAIDLLASLTKGWKQEDKAPITLDGEELACTKENAVAIYERFPWINEQIDAAIGDRANFIKS